MTDTTQTENQKKNSSDANVDKNEIAKFEAMANSWWDTEGEFKPLHLLNPVRANYIDSKSAVAEKKLLDVGCGGGILSEAMAQRGAIVTGIDMGEKPLTIARLHALECQLEVDYIQATAEDFAEEHAESFDIVTCLEMLEHVPTPESIIQACADLLRPGGHLFLSTINRNLHSYAMSILGAEYILKWLPKGTHEYKKFIKPSELERWVRSADLQSQDICGFKYSPLTQSFSISETDVKVNYILHAQKPIK